MADPPGFRQRLMLDFAITPFLGSSFLFLFLFLGLGLGFFVSGFVEVRVWEIC